jgi:hypothetical protein
MAGQLLGLAIGRYFIARATGSVASVDSWTFDGEGFPALGDFTGSEIYDPVNDTMKSQPPNYLTRNAAIAVKKAPMLNWLWNEAVSEW